MGVNPISKLPLRVTMPLILVIPVIVTAVALFAIAAIQGRASASRLAWENLVLIHNGILNRVDVLLTLPGRSNQLNATLIREGKLDTSDLRSWSKTLLAEARGMVGLSSFVWGSESGHAVMLSRYAGEGNFTFAVKDDKTEGLLREYTVDIDGNLSKEPIGALPFDTLHRPWYESVAAAGRPAWTEPYVWVAKAGASEETLGIAYGQPLRDSAGRFTGVIASEFSLEDISRFLSRLHIGKTGIAFIVNGDERLIARSTGTPVIDPNHHPILACKSDDQKVAAAANYLKSTFGQLDSLSGPHRHVVEIAGQRDLLMATPLNHRSGLRWLIVTVVPESDFLAEVMAARRASLGVAAAVVLLVIVGGVILAVAMTQPILALVAYVRRIGAGDLQGEISLRQSPELAKLSDEINAMTAGLRDRMRMRHSLAMAMEVQQHLLPQKTPVINGLDLTGHSTYCDETGGDYYDYLELIGLSDSAVTIALGDVSGHGIAAAMIMATARGILRSRCCEKGTLADLLTHMNALLTRDSAGERFMTMLLMTLDSQSREMRWASAGHDMPFIYDPSANRFLEIEGSGLPLGIMEEQVYEEYTLRDIPSGMIFLAATDGVWEAVDGAGEAFGKDRICDVIRRSAKLSAAEIGDLLRKELAAFRGTARQLDDITFVVARMK